MHWLTAFFIAVVLSAGTVLVGGAEPVMPPQTIQGNLLTIEGDNYVVRDVLGRFIRLRVNKNTQRVVPVRPGENIEARVLPDGQALAIRPTP